MNTRIRELRKNLKLSQRDFGKRLGVKDNAISRIESGERNLTDQMFLSICREFSINEHWLRTGDGEMYIQSSDFSLDELAKKNNLVPLELDIIKDYMELDEKTRQSLLAYFKNTFARHAETAATVTPIEKNSKNRMTDEEVKQELADYQKELEAAQKGQSALQNLGEEKKA
ncbi:helix-turn-helix domain-containing protein [Anaerosinus massiliensis]|uniref:helix-turn-helix domain-containing protein n=1 Tax=Massilibacillus massiliensis TaxID=1806837 RepID=UPI000DA61419|nr:helix-turn-helix transcriptional regulator [Massilibacillus massiliensis]